MTQSTTLSVLALLSMGCSVASAKEKDPYSNASGTPYASASVSALAPEDVTPALVASEHPPWKPDLSSGVPPPDAPSPAPTRADWASASHARDARVTDPGCTVKRIREWVRIECKFVSAIERISGPMKDVSFACSGCDGWGCDLGSVTFAMRRGERHAYQAFRATKWGPVADSFISAQLLEGDAVPLLSVQGIRGGF